MTVPMPTSHWPLASLMRSLARAGWGALGGPQRGARIVLRALADVLPDKSAMGRTTAAQLADASGYSKRWVEQQLRELEAQGIIVWTRGGIAYGKPRPSIIKVVKAKLVELITAARPELAARVARRAEQTAARLAKLPMFLPGKRHNRRSAHAEVATTPHPLRGGTGADTAAPVVPTGAVHSHAGPCDHGEPRGAHYCALCRRGIPA